MKSDNTKRLEYLELKLKTLEKSVDVEEKYRKPFEKFARYDKLTESYNWRGVVSKDVRELFIEAVLLQEKVKFKSKYC